MRREGKERLAAHAAATAATAAAAAVATPATTTTTTTTITNSESETTAAASADDFNFTAGIQSNDNNRNNEEEEEEDDDNDGCNSITSYHSSSSSSSDSFSSSAVGHLMNDVHSHFHHYCYGALHPHNNDEKYNTTNYKTDGDYNVDETSGDNAPNTDDKYNYTTTNNNSTNDLGGNSVHGGGIGGNNGVNDQLLQRAYRTIRIASMQAILSSLFLYSITAAGVAINTRGLDPKVIAIIIGTSQFMTALMVVIVTAKVPQWVSPRA